MFTVQYYWLDVFRHIVSKLHILTSNNFYKSMSTVQYSLLAAVRRILAGLLEGDMSGGGGLGDFFDFLATLVPGVLLFYHGDLAALGDLFLCRGDLVALGIYV